LTGCSTADPLDEQQLDLHSSSRNSIRSSALSARRCSQVSRIFISSSSSSLAAEEATVTGCRALGDFLGDANSSSSGKGGNGMRPSAAILAISSFLAIVLRASRSCSTSLIISCSCTNSSCTPTSWYRAENASCSLLALRSFSCSRSASAFLAAVRAAFSSSCSLTTTDCDLKFSLRARRISFSHSAWVCAWVSFALP
jgi:hypothetical protein